MNQHIKHIYTTLSAIVAFSMLSAQSATPDTVIVNLANTSRIMFTMEDPHDLDQLHEYDYQALFDDILFQLEARDSGQTSVKTLATLDKQNMYNSNVNDDDNHDYDGGNSENDIHQDDDDIYIRRNRWSDGDDAHNRQRFPYTRQFFNLDLGINYLHENGIIPDPNDALYAVRPWGSWYVGLNTVQRTHLSRKFAVEWSFGASWYNFKFYEDDLRITRDEEEVYFDLDPRPLDFTKSKLTVSYLNASFIPMYDAGGRYKDRGYRRWQNSSFRIGAGPYAGIKLGSYTKQQYEEDGDKEFDRERDDYYIQDFRYGIRLQVGIQDVDLFFAYDLNELFEEGRGPEMNAFSFGIVF